MNYVIKLIQVKWSIPSADDAWFYFGPSFEGAFTTLRERERIEIRGRRLQIGPLRVLLGVLVEVPLTAKDYVF